MTQRFDLLIHGGQIVDGSGAPARPGSVGVRDGLIAGVGELAGEAAEVIDAEGAVISPGFVDIHTHYDAQILWDRQLTVSPWHGVTSVVLGNCGFGIAPTRPAHLDLILRTLENVEGMSLEALRAGVGGDDWPFETFPEYLDALEARGSAINVAALLGHTPLRMYVMGEASTERAAEAGEVERMRALVAEALEAGAIGFASSMAPPHMGYDGRPVPSRLADFEEIRRLCEPLRGHEGGVIQAALGPGLFFKELAELSNASATRVSWTALLADAFGPDGHRGVLEQHVALQADGVEVYPQVSCRPLQMEYQFSAPFPLESLDCMRPVLKADRPGKKEIYADPEFRARLRDPDLLTVMTGRWENTVIAECPSSPELAERNLAEVASERGVHPVDLALDLALQTDLEARFRVALMNVTSSTVAELLQHPAVVLGLSDAGAHAAQLCAAGFSPHLLGHWVREAGVLSLEQAVRLLTSRSAEVFGLEGRGRLEVGHAADITLFDPETVSCGPLRRVDDLPAGADRLITEAEGILAVIVNGTPLRRHGQDLLDPAGPLPGRILRHGRG